MTTEQIDRELDRAAFNPYYWRLVTETKNYRAIMLHSQGRIMAQGYKWSLVGKSIGAGLYEITLKRVN